jgi:hypothetical protein
MKSLEDLKAQHAREIEALHQKHDIAAALPVPPHQITMQSGRVNWVNYKVQTLSQAVDIFRAFDVIPADVWKSGCTLITPESLMGDRERATYGEHHDSGPWACWVDVRHGEGFGPDAQLVFYAQVSTGPVRVGVSFGTGYIGMCHALAAVPKETRAAWTDRLLTRIFNTNPEASGASDKVIAWASGDYGPIKKSAHHSYLFCADTSDTAPGVKMSHALAQLAILADRAKV